MRWLLLPSGQNRCQFWDPCSYLPKGRVGVQQNGLSLLQAQLLARPIQNEKAELFRSSAFFVLLGFAQNGWKSHNHPTDILERS